MKKKEKDKFLVAFGKRLQEIRREKNISQDQLAFDAGVSISSISKMERGLMNISITNIQKLSEALKISHQELMNFDT